MGIEFPFKETYEMIKERVGQKPAEVFFWLVVLAIASGALLLIILLLTRAIFPATEWAVGLLPSIGDSLESSPLAVSIVSVFVLGLALVVAALILRKPGAAALQRLNVQEGEIERHRNAIVAAGAKFQEMGRAITSLDSYTDNQISNLRDISAVQRDLDENLKNMIDIVKEMLDGVFEFAQATHTEFGKRLTDLESKALPSAPDTPDAQNGEAS